MKQRPIKSISTSFQLVPPMAEEFSVYGGADTVARARSWALDRKLFLYRGPAEGCVHALYRMDVCAFGSCEGAVSGMDHTQVWVPSEGMGAFILTQPYEGSFDQIRLYAKYHGLNFDSLPDDGWYGAGTTPYRLTIPSSWPMWQIEKDCAVLMKAQPIGWPS